MAWTSSFEGCGTASWKRASDRGPGGAGALDERWRRGCRGLNVIGGDLVEVAPAYDTSGNTSLVGANLLFEMLCVLPGVERREA